MLAQFGVGENKLQQLLELLAGASGFQKAAAERKAAEDAATTRDATEATVVQTAVATPAATGASARACTGGDGLEADLMDLCENAEPAVAERAKRTLEDLREAKRRRSRA